MDLMRKILQLLKIGANKRNDSLVGLTERLMRLRDGNLYEWELLITYPSVNMVANLIDGIKQLVKQNNFIGTMCLTRSLIETVMVFVYDCTSQKPDDFYKKFVENGRLMKFDTSKNQWVKLRDDDLIRHFESVTQLSVRKTYDTCCNILHFSSDQIKILADANSQKEGTATIKMGAGALDMPKEKWDEILKFADDCEEIIKKHLRALIENKASIKT